METMTFALGCQFNIHGRIGESQQQQQQKDRRFAGRMLEGLKNNKIDSNAVRDIVR